MLQLRKQNPAIVYGVYDPLLEEHEKIYAFTRTLEDERLLVILNFTGEETTFGMPENISYAHANLLIANYDVDPAQDIRKFSLRPYEARVYHLNGS